MTRNDVSDAVYMASLILIILIYSTAIIVCWQLIKFVSILNFNEPFFKCRQPKLNVIYITSFLFVLYVLNPVTLFLSNIYGISSTIPLFVNDIADILIFLVFFPRAWILWFDRAFIDNLKHWIWRRELNPQDANFLIKYRAYLNQPHLLVYFFYLVLIAPIFVVLHILPYFNIIPLYCSLLQVLLLLLLFWSTLHIVNKIAEVSDEYSIRCELLQCIKTAGIPYTISHVPYIIAEGVDLGHDGRHWALLLELLFVCIADLLVIYYACYWTRNKFEFHRKVHYLLLTKHHGRRQSFTEFLPTRVQFQDIMDHREGVQAFCNHLVNEFGLESMLFLLQVVQFKGIVHRQSNGTLTDNVGELCDMTYENPKNHVFSAANILNISWLPIDPRMYSLSPYQIALHLYDKYIDESADLCINIPFGVRRGIYRFFQELSQQQNRASIHDVTLKMDDEQQANPLKSMYEVYDSAFKDIWRLVQTDSFIRFRNTEEFRRLISVILPDDADIANRSLMEMVDEEIRSDQQKKKELKMEQKQIENKLPRTSLTIMREIIDRFPDVIIHSETTLTNTCTTESVMETAINSEETMMVSYPLSKAKQDGVDIDKYEPMLHVSQLPFQQLSLPLPSDNIVKLNMHRLHSY